MEQKENYPKKTLQIKTLLALFSYHHKNTEKIANVFAKVLDAQIKISRQIRPEELQEYDLVGFGSGIYGEKHHASLLDLADRLPPVSDKKAFIFSTNGVPAWATRSSGYISPTPELFAKNHRQLKEKLQSKGYTIVGEFSCAGFNTNSFLKYFGGINKGRPNAEDLESAEEFARGLKRDLQNR
jgi:flavodoxin